MNADFFKGNQHYVNISDCLKQSTLFEAYRKTSKQDCQFFFVLLWAKLTNQITEKDFNKELLKKGLAFEEIENNDSIVSGRFELETKKTFTELSLYILMCKDILTVASQIFCFIKCSTIG